MYFTLYMINNCITLILLLVFIYLIYRNKSGFKSSEYQYQDVNRNKDGILYMAFYFPQYHIIPENKMALKEKEEYYTDWDIIKRNKRSFTPYEYYNLSNNTHEVLDLQDTRAFERKIGVFIFYHYWLDNSMVLNHPVELFMQKKRKTKFMLCWDNESGFLGTQKYDQPEKHAYQLLRYFQNENYLTDKNGKKPFLIYLTPNMDVNYISRFVDFLKLHNIVIKIGHNFQIYKNNWELPSWSEIACQFGPHQNHGEESRKTILYEYEIKNINPKWGINKEYWQGAITSWDSRPRSNTKRTHQKPASQDKPNGLVSPDGFGKQLEIIKKNIHPMNKDKIITIFAWNEWAEGSVLEKSLEFGDKFIDKL